MKQEDLVKRVRKLYKDPCKLLERVWGEIIPGKPLPTPLQEDMLKYVTKYSSNRATLEAFRGCGKSWISGVAVVWFLLHNPQLNIMVVSAAQNKAQEFANFVHSILNTLPELEFMLPRPDQRNSVRKFDVNGAKASQSASVYCTGVTGQIEGSRAHIIIADDVEVLGNSSTQDKRMALLQRTSEFDSIIVPPTKAFPSPKIIFLGTKQTQESIYDKLVTERGYDSRIYPVVLPTEEQIATIYKHNIAPFVLTGDFEVGSSIEPTRFDDEYIAKKRLVVGESYFRLHFMLDTSLSDADRYPLHASDLIVRDNDVEVGPEKLTWQSSEYLDIPCLGFSHDRFHAPMETIGKSEGYDGIVMSIDPSGKGADETAYAVTAVRNGYVYVLEFGGLKGGYEDETLKRLALIAKRCNVNRITTESNFGGGMFTQLFRPVLQKYHRCSIEDFHNTIQKETRIIDTLEPLMNRHKLVMDKRSIERDYRETEAEPHKSMIYQMTHITRERRSLRHDDRVDALAMAVSYWVSRLNVDADQAMEDAWLEEYLRENEREFGKQAGDLTPRIGDYLT